MAESKHKNTNKTTANTLLGADAYLAANPDDVDVTVLETLPAFAFNARAA